jgi:hypothetical protein
MNTFKIVSVDGNRLFLENGSSVDLFSDCLWKFKPVAEGFYTIYGNGEESYLSPDNEFFEVQTYGKFAQVRRNRKIARQKENDARLLGLA